jgi:DNA ligase-1
MKTLYSVSKTGKTLVWSASIATAPNRDGHLEITVVSGQESGKKVSKVRLVKGGKNLGRSNETSVEEQAEIELERLYKKQYDGGYVDDVTKVSATKQVGDVKKPQLAAKYPEKAKKLGSDDRVITQPKIDGVRCFITQTEEGVQFTSRTGKPITSVPRIVSALNDKMKVGDILDGELYIEGYDLQDILSVISPTKNLKLEELTKVKIYWYDYIPEGKESESYETRFLNADFKFNSEVIDKIESKPFNKETLESVFDEYIEAGFEGMMLRSIDSAYKFGRRSDTLLKYKKMETDEFEIVDIITSDQDEAPRFVCDLRNGNTVTVRLVGDKGSNMKYLEDKDNYIGSWLTIKYQTWTKTGSLQFPVGEMIREGSLVDGVFIPSL